MFGRFILVGMVSFLIDLTITMILVASSFDPASARAPAIAIAMLFAWLANRYFTYQFDKEIFLSEPLRYAFVAISVSGLNYAIYLILLALEAWVALAIFLATACQAIFSFWAYRQFVFQQQGLEK